jgi:hypothetical protein
MSQRSIITMLALYIVAEGDELEVGFQDGGYLSK